MKRCIALLLMLVMAAGAAFAQRGERDGRAGGPGKNQSMTKDERQRMRDDMREVFRDRNRQDRPPARQLSPQEREKLRRDIQDANKSLRK